MITTIRKTLLVAGMLAATTLAACRDTGSDPAQQASPAAEAPPVISVPSATPTETAAASIIRPDVISEPVLDVPPEPLELTVTFPQGSALAPQAAEQLAGVLQSEALAEGWPIVLRGHSDNDGSSRAANLAASRRRAQVVAEWLVAHGIDQARISVIALGAQNPVAPNAQPDGTPSEAGRARNRRVEITIASPTGEAAPAAQDAEREPTAAERLNED